MHGEYRIGFQMPVRCPEFPNRLTTTHVLSPLYAGVTVPLRSTVMGMSFILLSVLLLSASARRAPEAQIAHDHQEQLWQWTMDDNLLEAEFGPPLPPGFDHPILPTNLLQAFDDAMDDDLSSDDMAPVPAPLPFAPSFPEWLSHPSPVVIMPNGALTGLHQLHDASTAVSHGAMSPIYFSLMRRLMNSTMREFCEYFASMTPCLIGLIYGNNHSPTTAYHYTVNTFAQLFNEIFNVGMHPDVPIMSPETLTYYGFTTFESYMQMYGNSLYQAVHPTDHLYYVVPLVSTNHVVALAQPLMVYPQNNMVQSLALGVSADLDWESEPMLCLLSHPYDANAYIDDVLYVHHHSSMTFDMNIVHTNDILMQSSSSVYTPPGPVSQPAWSSVLVPEPPSPNPSDAMISGPPCV